MSKSLPARPNLEQLKNQAKDLHKSLKSGDSFGLDRFRQIQPKRANTTGASFSLSDAQLVIAREYGFASWTKLKEHVEEIRKEIDPLELLKRAFHADDATQFSQLLESYPQFKTMLNEPIGPFDSPLINNVRSREMLEVLLEAGADINARSRWWAGGFGLLHGAEPELARYAIQRGAMVDVHAAARLGLLKELRELIAKDATLVHARGGDGQTPLHFASSVEIAEFLLEHGADIDARDVDHESTPTQWMVRDRQEVARHLVRRCCRTDLLLAAALGEVELVCRHLDENPACIHLRVSDVHFPMSNPKAGGTIYKWQLGWHVSAHDVARQFGHENVFRLLMERSPAEVKLFAHCWAANQSEAAFLLVAEPGLVSRLSAEYRRQLAHAARNNNLAAARVMLAVGLPVDVRGQHDATPLHWAAFHGNAEMTRELLQHAPPLELKDADFQGTPLGWAIHGSVHGWNCRTGNYAATVEQLLQAGATLPEKTSGGTDAVKDVLRRYGLNTSD